MQSAPTKKESALALAALTGRKRSVGSRAFQRSESFKKKQVKLLEERSARRRAEARAEGRAYEPEPRFQALEAIRNAEWARLSETEKDYWKKVAKENPWDDDFSA
jgi:hypothetical protein